MRLMFIIFWSFVTLFMMSQHVSCIVNYEMNDDSAHGVRFAGNDQFTVLAINSYKRLIMTFSPYKFSRQCYIEYPMKNFYVYSLDVILNNNNITSPELYRFLLVGEEMTMNNVHLLYYHLNGS